MTMKRKCKHPSVAPTRYVVARVYWCVRCGAVGVRSLGPSVDDHVPPDEMGAAKWAAVYMTPYQRDARLAGRLPPDLDVYDCESELGFVWVLHDPPGVWPWDPSRPVAGQYEEFLRAQEAERAGARNDERVDYVESNSP
jgi:hypothetical protein